MPGPRIVKLSRTECLRLLQYEAYVGRVAFVSQWSLQLRPVNYLADERGLVFCTTRGGVLAEALSDTLVVFEVDASQPLDHSGWSVIVQGKATEITDADQLALLRRGPLKSWAVSPSQAWVRIDIEAISGVRIPAH